MTTKAAQLRGCLLGLAVGDALGLPREGLSARRARRIFGDGARMCLLPGIGMGSDDTEHAEMTLRALAECGGDPERFSRILAWKLRWWLAALPAGIGLATLRSIGKLWLGFPPRRSGVRSAGNGPCMRSPVIGVFFASDPVARRTFVEASTRLTHTDPRALRGAMIVAECAALAANAQGGGIHREDVLAIAERETRGDAEGEAWSRLLATSLHENWSDARFLEVLGCSEGVTGYVYRTVPAVLRAWLLSPADFRGCLARVLAMGGDADTTGAIAGALCGTLVGGPGIPGEWIGGIRDFPRSPDWLRRVADMAADERALPYPERLRLLAALPRNLLFMAIVLLHGGRRLLPPC